MVIRPSMTLEGVQSIIAEHGVLIVRKSSSWPMRVLGLVLGARFSGMFTTIRFPGCRPRVYVPESFDTVAEDLVTMAHEMVHVLQFAPWYGPAKMLALYLFFPLPFLLSGRFLVEREAFMVELLSGIPVDSVVDFLWSAYYWPWPKSWMRAWFVARLEEMKAAA